MTVIASKIPPKKRTNAIYSLSIPIYPFVIFSRKSSRHVHHSRSVVDHRTIIRSMMIVSIFHMSIANVNVPFRWTSDTIFLAREIAARGS